MGRRRKYKTTTTNTYECLQGLILGLTYVHLNPTANLRQSYNSPLFTHN